jgi:hypothetical protein
VTEINASECAGSIHSLLLITISEMEKIMDSLINKVWTNYSLISTVENKHQQCWMGSEHCLAYVIIIISSPVKVLSTDMPTLPGDHVVVCTNILLRIYWEDWIKSQNVSIRIFDTQTKFEMGVFWIYVRIFTTLFNLQIKCKKKIRSKNAIK